MTKIDISGLHLEPLIEAMWVNSKPASFFASAHVPSPKFDPGELRDRMSEKETQGYFYLDYLCGRVFKMRFDDSNMIDPTLYDRDNGDGACQRVVDYFRANYMATQ
jgi:hypothetical protein